MVAEVRPFPSPPAPPFGSLPNMIFIHFHIIMCQPASSSSSAAAVVAAVAAAVVVADYSVIVL